MSEPRLPEAPPRPPYFGRIAIYLAEMFPLQVYLPGAALGYFGLAFLFQALGGAATLAVTWRDLIGAFTIAGFSLLMRLFDELKDEEADRTLFPHRPVPSGRVAIADIRAFTWTLGLALLLVNAPLGTAFIGFAVMLAYGLLTFRYFFVPKLHAGNLLLTVATHNPATLFANLYVWTVYLANRGLPLAWPGAWQWLAIAVAWLPVLAWEFSRKIRAPESETEYITYSSFMGPRGAASVPFTLLTLCAVGATALALRLGLPAPAIAVLALTWLVVVFGFGRFLVRVRPAYERLKPFAEAYSLGQGIGLLAGLVWHLGVVWVP